MASQTVHLNDTMGCAFIGVLFAVILYGVSCAQTMYYLREYPKDKWRLKILVGGLWILDSGRTALDIEFLWYWLVTNHEYIPALADLPGTFTAEFFLASLTVCIVQSYFILIIWRLLAERWYRAPFTLIAFTLCLISFVGGVVSVERINLDTNATLAVVDATIPAAIQTVTAFVTDALITVSLCWILWGQKTGFKRTETLITTLIIYSIHRGIFTGLIQLAHFATFISTLHEDKLYWMIFHVPGSKIYVNSLLAVLNIRHNLSETGMGGVETHFSVDVYPLDTVVQSSAYSQTQSGGASRTTPSHTRIMFTKEIVRDNGEAILERAREDEDISRKPSPW